jgi:3-hydroxybutyryl-CoA dehydrogenase
MMIAVMANDAQWDELTAGSNEPALLRISSLAEQAASVDGYIILEPVTIEQLNTFEKPVLLNAVAITLQEMKAAANVLRINGWNGFLSRKTWEITGVMNETVKNIFVVLNKQFIEVADEPGLIAARTIAMIINEAYFALGEEVSSKAEIDTAMKLGTNYPYGPFEWATKIGAGNIYQLLLTLSKTDQRYLPAPLLKQEAIS